MRQLYKEQLHDEKEMKKMEMTELAEYKSVVGKGKNARQFSNFLSGWTDPAVSPMIHNRE